MKAAMLILLLGKRQFWPDRRPAVTLLRRHWE